VSAHQFREDGSHYNGGAEFFGYGYVAIGEPRLLMVRKWFRRGKKAGVTEDSFSVDGERVADYAEALEKLKTPPVLTEVERQKLAELNAASVLPDVQQDMDSYLLWRALRCKGFVRMLMGKAAITDAGRAALATPTEQGGGDVEA
jgi:hypothetical protein